MIRTLHRVRGTSAVGATAPGQTGPFGVRPREDDDQADQPDGQDHDGNSGGSAQPVSVTASRGTP